MNQDSTGVETVGATQVETQCEDTSTSGQTTCDTADQDPPRLPADPDAVRTGEREEDEEDVEQAQPARRLYKVSKGNGTSVQTGGNSSDTFTVSQTSTQDNDTGSGQTNLVQGDCSTPGNCSVNQTTNIDGQQTTNDQSGQSVDTTTTCTGSDCTSSGPSLTFLPDGMSVSNTDVIEFGVGGMRGNGTRSFLLDGIDGSVFRAFLYWHGPTNSSDPNSNADVMLNGTPVTGTNIGTDYDNFWGFENSQSYRADVTSLVTGNGTYNLSDFTKGDADVNGAALIIFYDDGDPSNDRNVVLWNGNDSNCASAGDGFTPTSWDETISGVPYPGSGDASLDFVVSDGQTFDDPQLLLDGNEFAPGGAIFQGSSVPRTR